MPGILPMKVIKCGSASQTRIAQACDRCRSKKIRCDGISPSCTQCLNVGFECKTSDKLSRRAFPRGYTESLEERVRQLENEIRELKDLLDEKDEKIDMMCKIRSGTIKQQKKHASPKSLNSPRNTNLSVSPPADDAAFVIQLTNEEVDGSRIVDSGSTLSNIKSLTAAFTRNRRQTSSECAAINVDCLFANAGPKKYGKNAPPVQGKRLGRASTDRLVNVFFQELAPLFPVLHRPTFLKLYNDFLSAGATKDHKASAQLHLVFSIAALSLKNFVDRQDLDRLEREWTQAMTTFQDDESLVNVQCLTLATMYHLKRGNYSAMLRHIGQAVALSQKLGLQCDSSSSEADVLVMELKKRTFWSLSVLDSFGAAHLGLSPLIDLKMVECQLPTDVDDEYITSTEITPSLPGEISKICSALALFKLSKILSRMLTNLYSPSRMYKLSFQAVADIETELQSWADGLASHLKLRFVQDKPSTNIISDRSPLISLAYHYVQILLLKPLILAQPLKHDRYMSAVLNLADASKKILQIIDLLDERNMAHAFCLNKDDIVVQSITGLLWQCSEAESQSALFRDSIDTCYAAIGTLTTSGYPGLTDLTSLPDIICGDNISIQETKTTSSRRTESADIKRGIKGTALSPLNYRHQDNDHDFVKSPADLMAQLVTVDTQQSFSGRPPTGSDSWVPASQRYHKTNQHSRMQRPSSHDALLGHRLHSDSLSLPVEDHRDWQKLLSDLDRGHHNIYDVIYGGPGADFSSVTSSSPEQIHHSSFPLHASGQLSQAKLWSVTDEWGLSQFAPSLDFDATNIARSNSSNDSPRLDHYGDIGFPIVIPDQSTPSSVDAFDVGWIPELDPLFRMSHG